MVEAFRQALRFLPEMLGCRLAAHPLKPPRPIPGMPPSASSPAARAASRLWSLETGKALPRICTRNIGPCSLPAVAASVQAPVRQCSRFTRFAKAMLAYLGAGVAVQTVKQISGEVTLYASEKQSHATWTPVGKPLASITDARSLWHRAITPMAAPKDDAVTCAPLPMRLPPSSLPFPNQKLLYGVPPPRAAAAAASVASSYKAALGRDDQSQAGSFQLCASWDSVDVPGPARSPSPADSRSHAAQFYPSQAQASLPASSSGSPGSDLQWGLSPGHGSGPQEDARWRPQGQPGSGPGSLGWDAGLGPGDEGVPTWPPATRGGAGGGDVGLSLGAISPVGAAAPGSGDGASGYGPWSGGPIVGRVARRESHGGGLVRAVMTREPPPGSCSTAAVGGGAARDGLPPAPELALERTSCSSSYLIIDETATNGSLPYERSAQSPLQTSSRGAPRRGDRAPLPRSDAVADREGSDTPSPTRQGSFLPLTPVFLPRAISPPRAAPMSAPSHLPDSGLAWGHHSQASASAPSSRRQVNALRGHQVALGRSPASVRPVGAKEAEGGIASASRPPEREEEGLRARLYAAPVGASSSSLQAAGRESDTQGPSPEGGPRWPPHGAGAAAAARDDDRFSSVQDVLLEFGEALCHSQTRAREAASAAAEALAARDRALQAFYYEASVTFAYGQWTAVLQAETTQLRKRTHKDNHAGGSAHPECARGKRHAGGRSPAKSDMYSEGEESGKSGDDDEVWHSEIACALGLAFALGLGLGGAVFFLGWSMGMILVAA